MDVMLIPQEKLRDVQNVLADKKAVGHGFALTAKGSVAKSPGIFNVFAFK